MLLLQSERDRGRDMRSPYTARRDLGALRMAERHHARPSRPGAARHGETGIMVRCEATWIN